MTYMQDEYAKIKSDIAELETVKAAMAKRLIIELPTFQEKFAIWWENPEPKQHRLSIPNEKEFPLVMELFEQEDPKRRGKTYDLEDLVGDDFSFFLEPKPKIMADYEITEEQYNNVIETYSPALMEAMAGNLKSFEADW